MYIEGDALIPNQWYFILESRTLKHNPVGITRLCEKMVAWRNEAGYPNVIANKCLHRGASLSQGKTTGNHIQSPFHGFEFDSSGKCAYIPANGMASAPPNAMKTRSYTTREAFGYICSGGGRYRSITLNCPGFRITINFILVDESTRCFACATMSAKDPYRDWLNCFPGYRSHPIG